MGHFSLHCTNQARKTMHRWKENRSRFPTFMLPRSVTFLLPIFRDFQYFHARTSHLRALLKSCSKGKQFAASFDQNLRNKRIPVRHGKYIFAFHPDDIMASHGKGCGSKRFAHRLFHQIPRASIIS